MYNHEHNDDYKVVLMWFIDIDDAVYGLWDEQHGGDKTGMLSVCDDPVKLFLILISYRTYMRYGVNCSIYWHNFVYDFLILHVCYIYVDILNYDVTISHHTYACINCQFLLHTFWDYFEHFIYMLYIQQYNT